MTVPAEHLAFANRVEETGAQDPMPPFVALAETPGIPVDDLVHHALVRWTAAGSEALMAIEPQALRDLVAAREREDWDRVAGIVDWLAAGGGSPPRPRRGLRARTSRPSRAVPSPRPGDSSSSGSRRPGGSRPRSRTG